MDTLVRADIFFFITSVAIVVIAIALLIALVHAIQILRDVRYITKRVRKESDHVIKDVEKLRHFVKEEGKKAINIKEIVSGVVSFIAPKKKRTRRKKTEE